MFKAIFITVVLFVGFTAGRQYQNDYLVTHKDSLVVKKNHGCQLRKTLRSTNMAKKKIDLAAEAADLPDAPEVITEQLLKEMCPYDFMDAFKKAKTQGQRVDFYYAADQHRKEINRDAKAMEEFLAKLGKWFMQELPEDDATGIAGKVARIQIKKDSVPRATDWPVFYAFIKKNNAFELLNRAVNAKSVKERWDNGKQVPGVKAYPVKKVSITKVK